MQSDTYFFIPDFYSSVLFYFHAFYIPDLTATLFSYVAVLCSLDSCILSLGGIFFFVRLSKIDISAQVVFNCGFLALNPWILDVTLGLLI